VLPRFTKAVFCPHCKHIRRELSRTLPGSGSSRAKGRGLGFAGLTPEERRELSSRGGLAAHGLQREASDRVERMLAAAKAERLAEERRTGQRRYTIEDGWVQRAGRSTLDGELSVTEMGE
jgi:hypothetical protein